MQLAEEVTDANEGKKENKVVENACVVKENIHSLFMLCQPGPVPGRDIPSRRGAGSSKAPLRGPGAASARCWGPRRRSERRALI